MKKYIFCLSVLFLVASCNNDREDSINGNHTEEPAGNKEIKIKNIKLTQGESIIENPLQDGVINLERRKPYRLEFSTEELVDFIPGDFLKVKKIDDINFFADFYGSNLNDIKEIVTLKKEGYKDLIITINQPAVVADFYRNVRQLRGRGPNYSEKTFIADPEGKVLKVSNLSPNDSQYPSIIPLSIDFILEVYLESIKDSENKDIIKVVSAGAYNDSNEPARDKYTLSIEGKYFAEDYNLSIKLPIYKLTENREKGEQLGEITIVGENTPHLRVNDAPQWYLEGYKTDYNVLKYDNYSQPLEIDGIEFYSQGKVVPVFIEDINHTYIESVTPYQEDKDGELVWKYRIKFKEDKRDLDNYTEGKLFDIYYGEYKNGEITKKENAQKREITLRYGIYT